MKVRTSARGEAVQRGRQQRADALVAGSGTCPEDADLVVVNKPAGMVVHPAPGTPSGTLVNALLHHCGESLSGGRDEAIEEGTMKIAILGGDGFVGWPTTLHLSEAGHEVHIVDNLSRRWIDTELGVHV